MVRQPPEDNTPPIPDTVQMLLTVKRGQVTSQSRTTLGTSQFGFEMREGFEVLYAKVKQKLREIANNQEPVFLYSEEAVLIHTSPTKTCKQVELRLLAETGWDSEVQVHLRIKHKYSIRGHPQPDSPEYQQ